MVGPNGAGKSTALLATAGVLSPTRGAISIGGVPIVGMAPEKVARLGLSMVPEGRRIFGTLTVEENLRIGTYQRTDRQDVERELGEFLRNFPSSRNAAGTNAAMLSGGEQQQLAIGRAFLTGAKILLIDEPSLGLAPMIIERVYDISDQFARRTRHYAVDRRRKCGTSTRSGRPHLCNAARVGGTCRRRQ